MLSLPGNRQKEVGDLEEGEVGGTVGGHRTTGPLRTYSIGDIHLCLSVRLSAAPLPDLLCLGIRFWKASTHASIPRAVPSSPPAVQPVVAFAETLCRALITPDWHVRLSF